MMRRLCLVLSLGLLAFAFMTARAAPASAQFRIGPHVGYNTDVEEAFVGGDAWFGLLKLTDMIEMHADVGFSWYFVEHATFFGIDLNIPFLFQLSTPILRPYAAAGLGIKHISLDDIDASDTDVGLNLIGGALFLADGPVEPFVQIRTYVSEDSSFEIMGGVLFRL